MNQTVNNIKQRLSLREPLADALEVVAKLLVILFEGLCAIDIGISLTLKVEIRAVQYENFLHLNNYYL